MASTDLIRKEEEIKCCGGFGAMCFSNTPIFILGWGNELFRGTPSDWDCSPVAHLYIVIRILSKS